MVNNHSNTIINVQTGYSRPLNVANNHNHNQKRTVQHHSNDDNCVHTQKKRERVDYSDETPQQQFGKMSLHASNPSNASASSSGMNPNLSIQNQTYLLQNNLAFAAQLQNQQNPN